MIDYGYGLGDDLGEMGYLDDLVEVAGMGGLGDAAAVQAAIQQIYGAFGGVQGMYNQAVAVEAQGGDSSGIAQQAGAMFQQMASAAGSAFMDSSVSAGSPLGNALQALRSDANIPTPTNSAGIMAGISAVASDVNAIQANAEQASGGSKSDQSTAQALNFFGNLFSTAGQTTAQILRSQQQPALRLPMAQPMPGINPALLAQQQQGSTMTWILGGLAVVGLLAVGAYFVLGGKKGKRDDEDDDD